MTNAISTLIVVNNITIAWCFEKGVLSGTQIPEVDLSLRVAMAFDQSITNFSSKHVTN